MQLTAFEAFKDFYECKGVDFLGIDWLAEAIVLWPGQWPLAMGSSVSTWLGWQGR